MTACSHLWQLYVHIRHYFVMLHCVMMASPVILFFRRALKNQLQEVKEREEEAVELEREELERKDGT